MQGWQCQKPQKLGVEIGHKNTVQITPSLHLFFVLYMTYFSDYALRLLRNDIVHEKKDVGMGLFVQCFYALSLHLVSVVFGTAIPIHFWKMLYLLVCVIFFLLYNSTPYRRVLF